MRRRVGRTHPLYRSGWDEGGLRQNLEIHAFKLNRINDVTKIF